MNHTNTRLIDRILYLEPIFELSLSFPCLLVNIYFALRFAQLDCFSPNLRILLVISNIITSLCTLIHPIPQLIPEEFYSVEDGRYLGAFLVYGIHHISMILLMIVDSKFLLIGLERWTAFKQRVDYEHRDGSGARVILANYIFVVTLLVSLKSALMFSLSDEQSMDKKLAWAFIAERCPILFVSTTCTAGLTWLLGAVVFFYLLRFTKKYRYHAQSLSESFQIRQTANVVEVMIPLLIAYAMAVLFSGTCMIIIVYFYFVAGHSILSPYYLVFSNAAYYSIPLYTIFSTTYMCWYFASMRRAIFQDLKWIFGIELEDNSIHPKSLNPEEEAKVYFEQLKISWNGGQQ